MKNLLLLSICFAVACNMKPDTVKEANDASLSSEPEFSIKKYIKEHFPEWEITSNQDYSNLWWSFYSKSGETSQVTADFNDDGESDYGVILKSKTKQEYKLVFLVSQKEKFKQYSPQDFNQFYKGGDLEQGIFIEAPGRIDVAYPTIKSLILKSNGVALRNFEINQCIYYWENNEMKVFTMNRER